MDDEISDELSRLLVGRADGGVTRGPMPHQIVWFDNPDRDDISGGTKEILKHIDSVRKQRGRR